MQPNAMNIENISIFFQRPKPKEENGTKSQVLKIFAIC